MPITGDQLAQYLTSATQKQVKDVNGNMVAPIGEVRNALRDFSFNVDANKLNALSLDQWNQLAPSFGGGRAINEADLAKNKQAVLQNLTQNNEIRQLIRSGLLNDNNFSNPDVIARLNNATKTAAALQAAGISSVSPEDQFKQFASFSPQAQVAAEKARAGITPTQVDNVINAEDFVNGGTKATVGGTPQLQVGKQSPIFFDPSNPTALFYIPAGSSTPVKITDPNQLQSLAQAGAIEVNKPRLPLSQTQSFLTSPTPTSTSSSSAGSTPGPVPSDNAISGVFGKMADQYNAALKPIQDQVMQAENNVLSYNPTDMVSLRKNLEASSGLNKTMDELATIDKSLADLLSIERRVPQTTLDAIQGTEVTQGILDRQRQIELKKLADTAAPLADVKSALEADLKRRNDLIDKTITLQKEADSFKLTQLGNALDFAVANNKIAADRAEVIFNAAVKDYELALNSADEQKKNSIDAAKEYAKQLADYYAKFGKVINPITGQVETYKAGSGTGGGSGASASQISQWANYLNQYTGADGYVNTEVYRSFAQQVQAMSGTKAREQFEKAFPPDTYLNPNDPTAASLFGAKPGAGTLSGVSDQSSREQALKLIKENLDKPKSQVFQSLFEQTNLSSTEINDLLDAAGFIN